MNVIKYIYLNYLDIIFNIYLNIVTSNQRVRSLNLQFFNLMFFG